MTAKKPTAIDSGGSLATVGGGIRAALPVALAYIGIGFAAGAVGARAGLSPAEVGLLSLLVFAGASQFIFADLLSASPFTLIAAVFLVNFRHFLYASSLAPKVKHLPLSQRVIIGAQLTDETFAVASSLARQPLPAAGGMIALNNCAYWSWAVGNVSGAIAGGAGGDLLAFIGIDFALAAMFAALLMLQITASARQWQMLAVATIAAAAMISMELWHPHPLNLLLAAGIAAAVGAYFFGLPKETA